MSGYKQARKIVPPHIRQAQDSDEAWATHQAARRDMEAGEAARAARRRAVEDETDVPLVLGVDAFDVLSEQVFEGRSWVVRSR